MKQLQCQIEIIEEKIPYRSDPSAIFHQLCNNKESTLLLESAEINKKQNLKSMMIIDTAVKITCVGQTVILLALSKNGQNILTQLYAFVSKKVYISLFSEKKIEIIFPNVNNSNLDEDNNLRALSVFDSLRWLLNIANSSKNQYESMFFGGFFSYDLISNFEKLGPLKQEHNCPDFCFYLAETLLVLDHKKKSAYIQVSLFDCSIDEKKRLKKRLTMLKKTLEKPNKNMPFSVVKNFYIDSNQNDNQYENIINKMKYSIQKGEIFQVVPSRRFYLPCPNSLSAYHILKIHNPSPYMFFMQDKDFTLFGASPESSLKYSEKTRIIELYPIAGTRPRGRKENGDLDLNLDGKIELEMRINQKELAEHFMLVDLARNDLAKICEPGSRYVADLTKVDRYSFVMHLVSRVIGVLKKDLDMFHAYRACMNMGTLSGAPKIRAMQLIAQEEKIKRGVYGGAIGYFTNSGYFDTCIIIRSAYVENSIATVQAGAGVVLDSNPKEEIEECKNKARAVFYAIAKAHNCEMGNF